MRAVVPSRVSPRALALCLAVVIAWPCAAHAMIAISLFRPPLRAAAAEAARCPGIHEGRHVVRLRIDGDGHGHDAEVTQHPEDTSAATLACIESAFERQAYPSAGSRERPVESIQVSFPFVVSPPEAPGARTR